MCLVLLGWRAHPEYRLIVAANRDEFFTRPTESLRWWSESPRLLAGRDLGAGGQPGTWLGLDSEKRRFAGITNVRRPREIRTDVRSRGALLMDSLRADTGPEKFLTEVADAPDEYNGFNLLSSDLETLWWHSNRSERTPCELSAGFHGLSNAAHMSSLGVDDTVVTDAGVPAWPKVREGVRALRAVVAADPADVSGYLAVLADRTRAVDAELPSTGLDPEGERIASSRFVAHSIYGTRCSTVLLVREDGAFDMVERTFSSTGEIEGEVSYRGRLAPKPVVPEPPR